MTADVYSQLPGNPGSTVAGERLPDGDRERVAQEAKSRLRQLAETGRTRLTEWKGGLETNVREKPIQSLLIAAAVGATIGLLIGRRSR